MSEAQPAISSGRRFSAIWIIPLVAVVIGVYMVVHTMLTEGPTITIDFENAEGLEAGKTKVRYLNVEMGLVEEVTLRDDLSGVTTTVKLERVTLPMLREDTRFWVVRARVGAGGVSGLSTILSGAYLELAPGTGKPGRRQFVGLETPPLTPAEAPGLRATLVSDSDASISVGDAILYNGYRAGRVESMEFDADQLVVRYNVFVDAPFHQLVNSSTRFWNVSGISVDASTSGVEVKMGSVETVLLGGVAFGTPPELPAGREVTAGTEFTLFGSYNDILKSPYKYRLRYVVRFKGSLRGLDPGAPVEYRGIQIGEVERIMIEEVNIAVGRSLGQSIPVLISLEPGRLELPDTADSVRLLEQTVERGVPAGLRATLQTGNLLTGKQLISVDFYPDSDPAEVARMDEYTVVPSIETGVARLEEQVSSFLETLNALPLEPMVTNASRAIETADGTLASLTATLDSVNAMLQSGDAQKLPADLAATLAELQDILEGFSQESSLYQSLRSSASTLNSTLRNLDRLTRQLSDKPNAVIFSPPPEKDPMPEASR